MSITCIDVNEEHFILIIVVSSYINPKHVYGSATILAGRGLWLYINLFGCLCGYPEHPPQHHSEAVCTNLNVVAMNSTVTFVDKYIYRWLQTFIRSFTCAYEL